MKALKANLTKGLQVGSFVNSCDNSGAKIVKITSVFRQKTVKGRNPSACIGDMVMVAVKRGSPEMRKQVVQAVVVRQKKEYRRPDGIRIKFEDNAVVILKDDKGNPKGTMIKGPIAKEACERWPAVAKIASVIV
ncbi:MAG: 50S ribosomal protein L14 [Candidatus Woesearchaeota archaeon]